MRERVVDLEEAYWVSERRACGVIGISSTIDLRVRLETCYLMEYSEDWPTDRSYIKREKIQEVIRHNRTFLKAQVAS